MSSLSVQPRDFVEAGLFDSESDVIHTALVELLERHPDVRIAIAVHRYEHDPGWSLEGIAQWAGVTRWEMVDILADRGVEMRLGPATVEEVLEEFAAREDRVSDRPT
jgi:Arc/MetJ-type ribon-helix-helix transcriptional regulator